MKIKRMKRFLGIMISFAVMLICVVGFATAVYADPDPDYVLTLDEPCEVELGGNAALLKFTVEEDGWYEFYTDCDEDTYATLYNSSWDELGYGDDRDDYNFTISEKLYAGYTYYLEVGAYENDGERLLRFDVMVRETRGVVDVEVTTEPDSLTVIEGLEMDTINCAGMVLTFTLSDGTEVVWEYNSGDTVNGVPVDVSCEEDETGHYYVDITCQEAFTRLYFETIENPVDYITYDGSDIVYYENTHGEYSEKDDQYNYYYDFPDDAVVTVYYKDGTSVEASIFDSFPEGEIEHSEDQANVPWLVGAANYIEVSYLGAKVNVLVTILPCPFTSITIDSAPTREYIFGDIQYGSMSDGSYWLYPSDLTGFSFTATLLDGTTVTYDENDIDMESQMLDEYEYALSEIEVTEPGSYEVSFVYKGMECSYEVEVLESPIESIEILKDPDMTEYGSYYYPIFDGMEIKISYTDGTSEIVNVDENNTEVCYDGYGYWYEISNGDANIQIFYEYDSDNEKEYYSIHYLGSRYDYRGNTFNEMREIESVDLSLYSLDGDGMQAYIEYTDGTTDELTYDMAAYYDYGDGYLEGYGRTKNGIAYYWIESVYEDGEEVGYNVYVLGEIIYIAAEDVKAIPLPYEDVTEADWFYDAVYYNFLEKTMTGMDETHFGPYGQLSRAQFALILYRIEGQPTVTATKKFGDITGDEWYGQAVLWAAEAGIVTGYQNGNFGPADMITREQMALMMYRYAKYLGADVTSTADISTFKDAASVSGFAADAMKWANGNGIITGKDEGTRLDPQGNTARAEAAAIIQRFMN